MPSLKTARSRYSPRTLSFATLIIVESRDPGERHPGARPAPIILQFAPMRQCPSFHKTRGIRGKITFDDVAGFDRDIRFMTAISRGEMRRRMLIEIHLDGD